MARIFGGGCRILEGEPDSDASCETRGKARADLGREAGGVRVRGGVHRMRPATNRAALTLARHVAWRARGRCPSRGEG
ncbi:MAG: hypothetical protein V4793_38430, partial [Paraburkholderia tropica]